MPRPEDSGIHSECFGPMMLLIVACPPNTGYLLLWNHMPISLKTCSFLAGFFNCHSTQQALNNLQTPTTYFLLDGSKISRQRRRQNRLSILWKSLLPHYSKILSFFAYPTTSPAFCTFHPYVSDACMFKLLKGRFRKATHCQRSHRIHLI